jgi:dTDP-4-dehydrorhamnose 3,5-epimerase-like enzyme
MAKDGVADKYSVQHLPTMNPPFPSDGGRTVNASGEMAQIVSNEHLRHVVYVDFKPDGRPRGNHYHVKMQMHGLYVIKGELSVMLVDLDDGSHSSITLRTGDLIRIRPRCAHVFVAKEYTQAIELNDTPFDPTDTIPYAIIEAKENT